MFAELTTKYPSLDNVMTMLDERKAQQFIAGFNPKSPTFVSYKAYLSQQSDQRQFVANEVYKTVSSLSFRPFVIGIPVIGFGNQSKITSQTIKSIKNLSYSDLRNTTLMLLVNRPETKEADATFSDLNNLRVALNDAGLQTAIADVNLDSSPEMGNLRSGIFDGVLLAMMNNDYDLSNVSLIATDDDNITMSKDFITKMTLPVLFDNPNNLVCPSVSFDCMTNKNILFPNFDYSEKLRQAVASDMLDKLSNNQLSKLEYLNTMFGGKRAGNIEPIVLSTMSMSAEGYMNIGGYSPVDEITKTVRLFSANTYLSNSETGIKQTETCVVTSNRRQLRAYLLDNAPSAAGWKGQNAKFKSNELDPARTEIIDPDNFPKKSFIDKDLLGKLFRITFDYMGVTQTADMKKYMNTVQSGLVEEIGYNKNNQWYIPEETDVSKWEQSPVFKLQLGR